MADRNKEEFKNLESVVIKMEDLAKVGTKYAEKRQKNNDEDNRLHDTHDLYGDNGISYSKERNAMPSIDETIEEKGSSTAGKDVIEINEEEEFIPIGARGKVQWKFAITAATTDSKIDGDGLGSLNNAVIQLEKMLKVKIQKVALSDPRMLAKEARDTLVRSLEPNPPKHKPISYLVPNPAYTIDPSTQQSPGVPVTPEEQRLADSGYMEYTFQVEINIKNNKSDIDLFPEFTARVLK